MGDYIGQFLQGWQPRDTPLDAYNNQRVVDANLRAAQEQMAMRQQDAAREAQYRNALMQMKQQEYDQALAEQERKNALTQKRADIFSNIQGSAPPSVNADLPPEWQLGYQTPRMEDPRALQQAGMQLFGLGDEQAGEMMFEQAKGLTPEQPEFQIIDGQYVPKRPGGQAMPIPGFVPKPDRPRSGMSVTLPDGTVMSVGGDGPPSPLGKTSIKTAEDMIFSTGDSISRLNRIEKGYDDKFSTLEGQAKGKGLGIVEWLGGDLSKENKRYLEQYSTWKMEAYSALNEEIKRITGAAVTKTEEPRLFAGMPDPKNDSPTEYRAKLKAKTRELRVINARYKYAKQVGQNWQDIPIDQMPGIMNEEGARMEFEARKAGMKDEKQIRSLVGSKLKQMFGI